MVIRNATMTTSGVADLRSRALADRAGNLGQMVVGGDLTGGSLPPRSSSWHTSSASPCGAFLLQLVHQRHEPVTTSRLPCWFVLLGVLRGATERGRRGRPRSDQHRRPVRSVTFIHDAPCSPSATVVGTPFPVTPSSASTPTSLSCPSSLSIAHLVVRDPPDASPRPSPRPTAIDVRQVVSLRRPSART